MPDSFYEKSETMRILMISDVYFPRINGVSTSIQTFRDEMEKLGHQVTLIAPAYSQEHDANTQEAEHGILRIPSRKVILDPEDRMMSLRAIMALQQRLQDQQFDLIHVHTPFVAHYAGVKLGRALQIPVVVTYHTLFEEYLYHYIPFLPKALLKKAARAFSRAQCNQVDSVIAPSSVIVDLLRGYGVQQHIDIIPTGIHSQNFRGGDGTRFREKFAIPLTRKVLLNVSRVAFEKNIGLLLETVQRVRSTIPDICLVIAGEGPAKKAYARQVQEMGLQDNVVFVGYLDRATELIDCYSCADFFVFSSRTETQGLVLLEAMAAGTPVVSVAAMGTRDILVDCAAAQIVEDNANQFAATLIELLGNEQATQSLRDACYTSAAQWDSKVMAEKMLRAYQRVLGDEPTMDASHTNLDISVSKNG